MLACIANTIVTVHVNIRPPPDIHGGSRRRYEPFSDHPTHLISLQIDLQKPYLHKVAVLSKVCRLAAQEPEASNVALSSLNSWVRTQGAENILGHSRQSPVV